ncbi:MAG: hypothetical protein HYY09_08450 [Firmicutes bacterium]|nr:hypothetical protein [Bacillota bacterium]
MLGTLAEFKDGSYGEKRLHKVVYMALRDAPLKPFTFLRYIFGQYSEDLMETKDQLLSMGHIIAEPIQGHQFGKSGNIYRFSDMEPLLYFQTALSRASFDLKVRLGKAVDTFGYLKEEELIKRMYALPEFLRTEPGEIFFTANLPERIEVKLDEEECDELELSLNPGFIAAAARIAQALDETEIDFTKLKTVNHP